MTSKEVKNIMFSLGAELCGIASVDRFSEAPKGYHPTDVLPTCRSVISFAVRIPAGSLKCSTAAVYTRIRNTLTEKLDAIALDFCLQMEKAGVLCVPVPTNERQLDPETGRMRGIVSQKHAAQAAGLGAIGRHSLLITPEFGSMVWLGCVLTELELEPDMLKPSVCDDCGLCVKVCPVNALEGAEVAQRVCGGHAFGDNPVHGGWEISCHACRDVCPFCFGSENGHING